MKIVVVPGLCGIVVNSPKVSKKTGNSIRAEAFAKKLTERYSWSAFDVLYSTKKQRLLQ
jgi:glutaminase